MVDTILDTTLSSASDDGTFAKPIELLVFKDGLLDVFGGDSHLILVPSSVAGQFQYFSDQVLEYGG